MYSANILLIITPNGIAFYLLSLFIKYRCAIQFDISISDLLLKIKLHFVYSCYRKGLSRNYWSVVVIVVNGFQIYEKWWKSVYNSTFDTSISFMQLKILIDPYYLTKINKFRCLLSIIEIVLFPLLYPNLLESLQDRAELRNIYLGKIQKGSISSVF